jgi:hypothetical protein
MVGGLALRAPALSGTLLADDWDHYAMQQRIYPVALGPWDMFNFVGESAVARNALLDSGRLPWWAAPDIHLAVFRPLSSLLVYADFALLDGERHPARMRWHSFFWWLMLLAPVSALYARWLPGPAAALALGLYAVDDAHVYPVAWIANRSEIVSVSLVAWALWADLASRTSRHGALLRVLAGLLVAMGLLAGEHAFAPLCYIFVLALWEPQRPLHERALRVLPYALIAGGYTVWRTSLGYGVAGSAFYIDPATEPLRFLSTAAIRYPLLLADLTFGMPAEWWSWGSPWGKYKWLQRIVPRSWLGIAALQSVQVAAGVVACVLCIVAIWRLGRAPAGAVSRRLSVLLLGALIGLIPLTGTAAMSRLTVAPAIAFDAAAAYLLWRLAQYVLQRGPALQRVFASVLVLLIMQVHVVRAAELSQDGSRYLADISRTQLNWVKRTDFGMPVPKDRHIIIVSAHDMASQYCLPYVMHATRHFMLETAHLLSPAADNAHVLTRPASNQLRLDFPDPLEGAPFVPMVYRRPGLTFYPGQSFSNRVFSVLVETVRNGEPSRLLFTFHANLNDPRYIFLYPNKNGLQPLKLPRVGETTKLRPPAWPR